MSMTSLEIGCDMSRVPHEGCCDPAACTNPRLRVVSIVLAAGEGRRLGGRPKGLIRVNGETLLARNVRVLQEAGVGCLLVGESLVKQDTPDVGIKKLFGRPV